MLGVADADERARPIRAINAVRAVKPATATGLGLCCARWRRAPGPPVEPAHRSSAAVVAMARISSPSRSRQCRSRSSLCSVTTMMPRTHRRSAASLGLDAINSISLRPVLRHQPHAPVPQRCRRLGRQPAIAQHTPPQQWCLGHPYRQKQLGLDAGKHRKAGDSARTVAAHTGAQSRQQYGECVLDALCEAETHCYVVVG